VRALTVFSVLIATALGCARTTAEVVRHPEAPVLEGTSATPRRGAPEGAIPLAAVRVRRNVFASKKDCEVRLLDEGAELGATHVVVEQHHQWIAETGPPRDNGTFDGCDGSAYFAPESERRPTPVPASSTTSGGTEG